ncbi:MAG: DUF2155 domain-containing protein [Alphaproteobacteria bacterium]
MSQRHLPAFLLILATTLAAPLVAQDVGEGGITTEKLEPLKPAGAGDSRSEAGAPQGGRFKPAPFRSLALPERAEPIEPVETVERGSARMRQLDKMTGRARTFEIAAGSEEMVDRLRVRLEACRSPDDNALHGTMAFVRIWDTRRAGDPPVFSGWMFAESPALSALDHPRYDVWVISCTTSAGEASAASE